LRAHERKQWRRATVKINAKQSKSMIQPYTPYDKNLSTPALLRDIINYRRT